MSLPASILCCHLVCMLLPMPMRCPSQMLLLPQAELPCLRERFGGAGLHHRLRCQGQQQLQNHAGASHTSLLQPLLRGSPFPAFPADASLLCGGGSLLTTATAELLVSEPTSLLLASFRAALPSLRCLECVTCRSQCVPCCPCAWPPSNAAPPRAGQRCGAGERQRAAAGYDGGL